MSVDRHSRLVFILGQHRSGTSILYNALVAQGCFCHPTPFHLAHFEAYLAGDGFDPAAALAVTRERFARRGIVDRFVDDIPAHALSPEEYGFVLRGGRIRPRNVERFLRFCEFVRSTSEAGRLLLLKNPRDFDNAPLIHGQLPEARFIFIHRHPGPTIDSRIRELRLLFSRRSPYQTEIEPAYDFIMRHGALRGTLALCLRPERTVTLCFLWAFRRQALRFLRGLDALPPESYTTVTYERLCSEPQTTLEGLRAFLGLPAGDLSGVARMIRPGVARPRAGRPVDTAAAAGLLRPYLEYCGYRGLWPAERQSR